MSRFVLTNVRLFTGGADLTGDSNKVEVSTEVEDKDGTNYASGGWKEVLGGLKAAEIDGEGQWEAGDPGLVDDASWAALGGLGPWTIGPQGAAVGALAYFTKAMSGEYTLGEGVGEVAPWTGKATSSWPLVRGVIEHPPGLARTVSGTTAGVELGAVPAGKRLFAALHVLSVAGTTPSLTVTVESSADDTFAAPSTQLSFDAADAVGGQIQQTGHAGLTDSWFRASYTVAGTSPSFMFAIALGVA